MGYSTTFSGQLKFTHPLLAAEMKRLQSILGEDCREHPEWDDAGDLTYVDLEISRDFLGIEWDGSEKTYDLVEKVNLLLTEMQKEFPEFGLTGELLAQGEDPMDRWKLVINADGDATEVEVISKSGTIICPHCGEEIKLS